ncbi:hypothetical protein [Falsirhodobacter halotolerans]|uniref:hypothetical protein n=1 Tax=Falsirhodobacter halotolerans TaxID=1146892 RepID=UPI001FD4E670|nr:hypothetical protein [Falsirhodobacter halotolerans]MCJ8138770.1 hypothetical protein [Falsirhodobacter halotolerans]
MRYRTLDDAINADIFKKGPVAVIMAEDATEIVSSLRRAGRLGFGCILLLAHDDIAVPPEDEARVHRIAYNVHAEGAMMRAMNTLIAAAPGIWFHYCFNGEYLFFPFCETRDVRELIAFHTEERRYAFLSYVVDLYAGDLSRNPKAVSLEEAFLDRAGYYALGRPDPANHGHPKDRQLDFFGGIRWRFEEHVPAERRRIDRIGLFQAKAGLEMRPDFTFNDEEYNTYSCPWHHSATTAVCSFRAAKALKSNPGSRYDIHDFRCHYSVPFQWKSQQLMDLGLMEPGQWV